MEKSRPPWLLLAFFVLQVLIAAHRTLAHTSPFPKLDLLLLVLTPIAVVFGLLHWVVDRRRKRRSGPDGQ